MTIITTITNHQELIIGFALAVALVVIWKVFTPLFSKKKKPSLPSIFANLEVAHLGLKQANESIMNLHKIFKEMEEMKI